jgi:glycosyltransferase involved in cell wall biosynthesis
MKISCILTSFNRPRWVKHALKSVADQTHRDFELIIIDDSTLFDIRETAGHFALPTCIIRHYDLEASQRVRENRISVNMNTGLSMCSGDLVCFLCDDDYYYDTWFASASAYFEANPYVHVAYGKLIYSSSREMIFPEAGTVRYPGTVVQMPFNVLDHNQVIHRNFVPSVKWPEDPSKIAGPDAYYWAELAKRYPFHPINAHAVVKRLHEKNLQKQWETHLAGNLDELRE